MEFLDKLLKLLASIGAINWGLIALFQFNLVEYVSVLMAKPNWEKYIYISVAVAGLYTFISIFKD